MLFEMSLLNTCTMGFIQLDVIINPPLKWCLCLDQKLVLKWPGRNSRLESCPSRVPRSSWIQLFCFSCCFQQFNPFHNRISVLVVHVNLNDRAGREILSINYFLCDISEMLKNIN